jgi:hypothetical protein
MSQHCGIRERLDGVGVGGERATEVDVLLELAEQQFDAP